jgi:hypothetical protein
VQTVRNLDAIGLATSGLALRRPSLDDVFLALTGHEAEQRRDAADQPVGRRSRLRSASSPSREV